MGVDLAWRLKRPLVGADEPGDRKAGLAAARKKLGPRAERMRQAGAGRGGVLAGAVADDEAAADRKPGLVGERGLGGVAGDKPQGVRVAWSGSDRVENNRGRRIEGDRTPPGEPEAFRRPHLGGERFGRVRFDAVRPLTAQAQNDRLVGRMAFASEGERAEQRDLD